MGSSKNKRLPKPPKIAVAPPVIEEADLTAQTEEMKIKADERMSVANTLMTSPVEPKQTMMSSVKKKKKKPENTPMGMY